jgi:hypothetical protein
MTDDTYEGWANRETWALNLWLSNDQGLYEMARGWAASGRAAALESEYWTDDEDGKRLESSYAGDRIRDGWDEITDPDEGLVTAENILAMVRDVGSEYRVDWDEIGRHWLEDVTENPVTDES